MNPLQQKLDINNERYRIIVSIKEDYLDGKLSLEEGNRILKEKLGTCTPDEFAYAEQSLKGVYKDEEILDKMDDLLNLFDGVLVRAENEYPENHPLWAYLEEINAVEKVALETDELLKQDKFIKNPSKPQVKLYELIVSIYSNSILNFPVEEVNRCIDIAIPEHMIAIEYDGSYWHQNEDSDKKRQDDLENLGWKFIRYIDYIPSMEELMRDIKCKI